MNELIKEIREFYKSAVFNCWLNKRGADVLGEILSRHPTEVEPLDKKCPYSSDGKCYAPIKENKNGK